jgi:hypothetical protein
MRLFAMAIVNVHSLSGTLGAGMANAIFTLQLAQLWTTLAALVEPIIDVFISRELGPRSNSDL